MKTVALAVSALIAVAAAGAADAAVTNYNFTVSSNSYNSSVELLFGLTPNPTLTGTISIDDTLSGAAAFVGLSYVTGTRSWTTADIDVSSFVLYDAMMVVSRFDLSFTSMGNYVISNNTAQVSDGAGRFTFCNGCVSFGPSGVSAVPEPATWAMMIGGFGAVRGVLRRKRAKVRTAVSFG